MNTTRFRQAARLAPLLVLAACQSYSPSGVTPGTPIGQVEARMGPRTGSYPLPGGGQRVEFARGPYGKHTYMVDTDATGKVTAWTQVLTEATFATIQPGMTREQVLRTIGHPSEVRWLGYQKRNLWSYRYDAAFCIWYQVSLDARNEVVDVGYATDPACEVNDSPPIGGMPSMRRMR